MKAMILAAGRGKRMRSLTDHFPKPLLTVGGEPLIVRHIKNLVRANIKDIIINLGYLGEVLENTLGDGTQFGARIQYSPENPVLETGGGIVKALPLLGDSPFLTVSGDIYTDFPFESLLNKPEGLAHLVLSDNPSHHPKGDYALVDGFVSATGGPLLNFAGIGVYHPALFAGIEEVVFSLPKLFPPLFSKHLITGEHYQGLWHNIGTPEQLCEINELLVL